MPYRPEQREYLPGKGFEPPPPSERVVPKRIDPYRPKIRARRERRSPRPDFKKFGRETYRIEDIDIEIEYDSLGSEIIDKLTAGNIYQHYETPNSQASSGAKLDHYRILKMAKIRRGNETLNLTDLLPK